jgi:MSHA pilin protein MshC
MNIRRPANGFTLVELIVTMVVAGIIAAVAIPRFADQQGFQSRAFFEQAQEAIKFSQKAAIAQRKRVFITIAAASVQACYVAACGSPGSFAVIDPTTGLAMAVAPQEARNQTTTVTFPVTLSPATTLVFDGLGRPRSAAGVLLTAVTTINVNSSATGDINRAILIEPETGYVHN